MATEKPRFTITLDEDLLKKVNDYRFDNRFESRSEAVVDLIKRGLGVIETKRTVDESFMAIETAEIDDSNIPY